MVSLKIVILSAFTQHNARLQYSRFKSRNPQTRRSVLQEQRASELRPDTICSYPVQAPCTWGRWPANKVPEQFHFIQCRLCQADGGSESIQPNACEDVRTWCRYASCPVVRACLSLIPIPDPGAASPCSGCFPMRKSVASSRILSLPPWHLCRPEKS